MTIQEALRWRPVVPAATDPPAGPIHCTAEYEPMEGLQISWEGPSTFTNILVQIAKEATSADGNGIVYVAVDDINDKNNASAALQAGGVDLGKVRFIITTTDTIWCRDYGPRYIYQGGCRAIIDHVYNRPRPNDDQFPFAFATYKHHAIYGIPLVHGGGNFHLDSLGFGYATRLVDNENPNYDESQIVQLWSEYQNLAVHLFDPFPITIDSTQHLDMWMQICGDHTVVISDWPTASGTTQDIICDEAAAFMQSRGYTVVRTPAVRASNVHYTYTNAVVFNGVVMIPYYTNSQVSQYNSQALLAWQQACPDKRIVQINCEPIISSAGALHCIVMHIPTPLGGPMPTAYLISPNGGERLRPGQLVQIRWISDDDIGTESADVQFSSNGGISWTNVANGLADSGTFLWTVPQVKTANAKIRIVVHDGGGNAGADTSDLPFSVMPGVQPAGRG
jgi:agmatine/peptidylarginine deiminase